MNNMPVVKLGICAVSRDCFPMELSERRRAAVVKACNEKNIEIYECPVTVENEKHMLAAIEDMKKAGVNALVMYLGNFGPETSETLLAKQFGAKALITGESLGQVASQTMEALTCTDAVVEMPVFRPLIGMDKTEIMDIANRIGTYETSILPYEDCCTVFTPRHPITRPKLDTMEKAESRLDIEALVKEAVEGTELVVIH